MTYRVEGGWQDHHASEHDDLVAAVNKARALIDDHPGAIFVITGPGLSATVSQVVEEESE